MNDKFIKFILKMVEDKFHIFYFLYRLQEKIQIVNSQKNRLHLKLLT